MDSLESGEDSSNTSRSSPTPAQAPRPDLAAKQILAVDTLKKKLE